MSAFDFLTKQMPHKYLIEKLKPKSTGMRFEVGEGLNNQQKQEAEKVVRKEPIKRKSAFDFIADIGRALPQTKTPVDVYKKTLGVAPKVGEVIGKTATSFIFGDVEEKGIAGIPEHIWEIERDFLKIVPKFTLSAIQSYKDPYAKDTKTKLTLPMLGDIRTYQQDAKEIFDDVIESRRPLSHALLPFIEVSIDATIMTSLLNSGAKSAMKGIKINPNETAVALKTMGLTDISEVAQKRQFRKLATELHPDLVGLKGEMPMRELNKANKILTKAREQGTLVKEPNKIALAIRKLSEAGLSKPSEISKIFAKREAPYLGVKGLLPEQAGTIPTQPLQARQQAMGLSIRDIKAKPIKPSDKALEIMRKPADKIKPVSKIPSLKTNLIQEAKKYKTTVNIQDKNDLEYLRRILNEDNIKDIQSGKMVNFRGIPYEDIAKVNLISKTPKTVEQQLAGKIKEIKLKSDTFYHGTSAENARGIMEIGFKRGSELTEEIFRGGGHGEMQNSISLTETLKKASTFSNLRKNGEIVEAKLKPNLKVVSIDGVEDAIELEDYISYLKKEKVDAVYIGGGEKELVVINPKVITPVKSQLTVIWKKGQEALRAEKGIKTLPKKTDLIETTKLLTTSDTPYKIGKGFIAKDVKKRVLSPKTRVVREMAKYRKTIAEKKLTDPLINKINKTETRKAKVRVARDYFNLTDAEVKSISKRDVGLMTDFEFKKFIDDFRIKAEEFADAKQLRIENIAAGYKPTAKLVKPEEVPIKALSGFDNFVDLGKIENKNIPYKQMDIAGIIRGDKITPAIRRSGFFANKEIQTANIVDTYSQYLPPHLMALKQNAYKKGGEFGVVFRKIWKPTENAIRAEKEFNTRAVNKLININKKHKIKMSNKNLEHLSDVMEGKVKGTPAEELYVKEIRQILDDLRNQSNAVREIMGKNTIGYIEDYIPHIQKADLWNDLLGNRATISNNVDFIIPNQTTNPFAYKRMLEELPKAERNLGILLDRYIYAIGRDIYITPAIENIKAYNGVLKNRGLINAPKYWDEYIRTGLIGKQHKIDLSLDVGQKSRKVLQKWNNMVNLAFLTGKISWNIAVQPLSYIMNVPMETGVKKSVTAISKSFKKPLRAFVKENSNVLNIKSADVRAMAVGEGRNIQNRIYRTKINKYNDFISTIGAIEERELTLASYVAGLDEAKQLGYKGKEALWYADLTTARTQSMYNRENRALILNSEVTRAVFPFSSFSLEMFNHLKEITTKAGGSMQLTYRQRTGKLMGLIIGLTLANAYSEALTGKKKTTVGTFIPFIGGSVVDPLISRAKGEQLYGGRSPITAVQIGEDIISGAKEYIEYGTSKKLRKVGINFGLALGGIGGGSQINNIIDGIMAIIDEDVRNIKGNKMFEVKDAISKIKAPIFGVWATKEGIEYWQPKDKKPKTEMPTRELPTRKLPTRKLPTRKLPTK